MAQVKKQEVRDAILAAALKLFSERGYNGSTLNGIAAEAGVSTANLYVYFPSKIAILYAIYDPWLRQRLIRLEREAATRRAARARLAFIFRTLWRDIPSESNGFANNVMQALSTVAPDETYDPALLRWSQEKLVAIITAALPPARCAVIDVEALVRTMFMAFDGFVMHQHLASGQSCTDATVKLFCDLLLGA